jgi:hypothetical protein
MFVLSVATMTFIIIINNVAIASTRKIKDAQITKQSIKLTTDTTINTREMLMVDWSLTIVQCRQSSF